MCAPTEVNQEPVSATTSAQLQSDRLQAVLAKARAIRGQSHVHPCAKPWVPTSASKTSQAVGHAAKTQHSINTTSRGKKQASQPTVRASVDGKRVQQQPKPAMAHGSMHQQQQTEPPKQNMQSMHQECAPATFGAMSQAPPLQLPASFSRALAAFRCAIFRSTLYFSMA